MISVYRFMLLAALGIMSFSARSCATGYSDMHQEAKQGCGEKQSEALRSLGIFDEMASQNENLEKTLKDRGFQYEQIQNLPYSDCLKQYSSQTLTGFMVFLSKGPKPGESVEVLLATDQNGKLVHAERRSSYADPLLSEAK